MLKTLSLLLTFSTLFGYVSLFSQHPPVKKSVVIEIQYDHPPVTTK